MLKRLEILMVFFQKVVVFEHSRKLLQNSRRIFEHFLKIMIDPPTNETFCCFSLKGQKDSYGVVVGRWDGTPRYIMAASSVEIKSGVFYIVSVIVVAREI